MQTSTTRSRGLDAKTTAMMTRERIKTSKPTPHRTNIGYMHTTHRLKHCRTNQICATRIFAYRGIRLHVGGRLWYTDILKKRHIESKISATVPDLCDDIQNLCTRRGGERGWKAASRTRLAHHKDYCNDFQTCTQVGQELSQKPSFGTLPAGGIGRAVGG